MIIRNVFYSVIFLSLGFMMTSCEKDYVPTDAKTADILTDVNPQTGQFTYFSFKDGATVAASESQTTKWDFGFKFTTMVVNSGVSGPGEAGVIIQNGVFNEIAEAPETGYLADQTGNLAIKDSEWYDYNPVTHTFAPKAGKVFIFKTADGKYAKMEILSATPTDANGNTVTPPTFPTKIKYTIRYAYQTGGSRKF